MVCTSPCLLSFDRESDETSEFAHVKASVASEAEMDGRVRRKSGASAANRILLMLKSIQEVFDL